MTERILRIRTEATVGLPHEIAKKQIDIIRDKNGRYYSECTWVNDNQERKISQKRLDTSDLDKLIEEISKVNIPAFPKHQMGCDGDFTEIVIGGYSGKSSFRWWSVPPDGWELLDKIVKKIIIFSEVDSV